MCWNTNKYDWPEGEDVSNEHQPHLCIEHYGLRQNVLNTNAMLERPKMMIKFS